MSERGICWCTVTRAVGIGAATIGAIYIARKLFASKKSETEEKVWFKKMPNIIASNLLQKL